MNEQWCQSVLVVACRRVLEKGFDSYTFSGLGFFLIYMGFFFFAKMWVLLCNGHEGQKVSGSLCRHMHCSVRLGFVRRLLSCEDALSVFNASIFCHSP